jgi:CHRD domain-containing protein
MRRFGLVALVPVTMLVALGLSTLAFGQESREFKAELSGAEEVPPVATATTGEVQFRVNSAMTEIAFELEIKNATHILGAVGAHLHCAKRGVNGPIIAFLAGPVPGGFDGKVKVKAVLTAANIMTTPCGTTIAAIVQAMEDGSVYANAHSPAHQTGEIRGQVEPD